MKVEVNGIDLNFGDSGEGVPVILLHGFPFDRNLWYDQVSALQDHCRVITPDLRGFGDSKAPEEPVSMSQYAADVVAMMDLLNIERAIVGGLSMGGYISLAIAEQYPERLLGLILSNTKASKDTAAQRQNRYNISEKTHYDGTEFLVKDLLEKVLCENTLKEHPDIVEYTQQMMRRQPGAGVRGALAGMAERKDREFILSEIEVPVLVISGKNDSLIPVFDSKMMVREMPHAHLEIIADSGHLSNLEQPELYNDILLRYIQPFDAE
ncbi:MAG: alpha/beta hydrolase [Candidatus Marinimicrobia bacterium]|nr:alpha/beta hydrolase [Candidatus Neomarinimicrobiota bacterium]MCF7827976.1 alpha/beta hydrolase [Candidatus Neomarinimicrobiota bacterium]MCF7879269.1 alpha/beta hydrolase [Candidatus Neomarinimicrobiota bacterium]